MDVITAGGAKRKEFEIMEGYKVVTYRLGQEKERLLTFAKMNLMKTIYRPRVLTRYPP